MHAIKLADNLSWFLFGYHHRDEDDCNERFSRRRDDDQERKWEGAVLKTQASKIDGAIIFVGCRRKERRSGEKEMQSIMISPVPQDVKKTDRTSPWDAKFSLYLEAVLLLFWKYNYHYSLLIIFLCLSLIIPWKFLMQDAMSPPQWFNQINGNNHVLVIATAMSSCCLPIAWSSSMEPI